MDEGAGLVAALTDRLAECHLRLGCRSGVRSGERDGRSGKLGLTLTAHGVQSSTLAQEQIRILGQLGQELARTLEEGDRTLRSSESPRPMARVPLGASRTGQEVGHIQARRVPVVHRLHEVMREHLGPVFGPVGREVLDPLRCPSMGLGADVSRRLPVRAVPDERVHEDVLACSRDRGSLFTPDELLSLERVQAVGDGVLVGTRQRGERICPEHLPEHGSGCSSAFSSSGSASMRAATTPWRVSGTSIGSSSPSASMRAYSSA